MANVALLLTIIAALVAISGLIWFVLHRRRAARSLITSPSRAAAATDPARAAGATNPLRAPAATTSEKRPAPQLDGHIVAAAETDAERRERLVEQAFLSDAVPGVWYRHAKAALAAEASDAAGAADAERTHG